MEDTAILLGSMAGHDPKDSTSVNRPVPDYAAACRRGVRGLRIGIPREYHADGMSAEIEALWTQGIAWLREAGAEIVDVSLPHTKYGLATYYIVAPAEASSNLARYDGVRFGLRVPANDLTDLYEETRAAGFGAEVRRRILIGTYVLSAGYYDAYYLKAQKVRALILRDFTQAFAKRRCVADADRALGRFRPRREERRPGADVSERRLHRAGVDSRRAGYFRACGAWTPTACPSGCRCWGGISTRKRSSAVARDAGGGGGLLGQARHPHGGRTMSRYVIEGDDRSLGNW